MFIKSIRLKNFKNLEDKTFEFKDKNILKGKNGSGKSTIKEAVLFAIYNQTPNGSKDTDRYIQKGKDSCEVELITDKHTYFRQRSKAKSVYKLDGKIDTQKNNKVPFEIFSSVFNVGYFMNLDKRTQQDLLLQNTPKVDKMELFKKLGGKIAWLELEDNLDDFKDTIKKVGSKKLAITKQKDKHKTQLEYLENFPFDKIKLSKPSLKKLKILIQKEINRIKLVYDTHHYAVSELQLTYKILSKLPIEEMKIKLKDLLTKLQKEFENVEIELTELYKSEMGYRDVFKFLVNGIEYKSLSSGEKLRFDLVISKFFNSLINDSINCFFVDNTVLLDEDIKVPVQSFITEIWPYDLEIT